jgi:hypothetical protein
MFRHLTFGPSCFGASLSSCALGALDINRCAFILGFDFGEHGEN